LRCILFLWHSGKSARSHLHGQNPLENSKSPFFPQSEHSPGGRDSSVGPASLSVSYRSSVRGRPQNLFSLGRHTRTQKCPLSLLRHAVRYGNMTTPSLPQSAQISTRKEPLSYQAWLSLLLYWIF
jgi:hypothetical protein